MNKKTLALASFLLITSFNPVSAFNPIEMDVGRNPLLSDAAHFHILRCELPKFYEELKQGVFEKKGKLSGDKAWKDLKKIGYFYCTQPVYPHSKLTEGLSPEFVSLIKGFEKTLDGFYGVTRAELQQAWEDKAERSKNQGDTVDLPNLESKLSSEIEEMKSSPLYKWAPACFKELRKRRMKNKCSKKINDLNLVTTELREERIDALWHEIDQ